MRTVVLLFACMALPEYTYAMQNEHEAHTGTSGPQHGGHILTAGLQHAGQPLSDDPIKLNDDTPVFLLMANTERVEVGRLNSARVRECGPPAWMNDSSVAGDTPERVYVKAKQPHGDAIEYVATLEASNRQGCVVRQPVVYINYYLTIYRATLQREFPETPDLARYSVIYIRTEDPALPGHYIRWGGILQRALTDIPSWMIPMPGSLFRRQI